MPNYNRCAKKLSYCISSIYKFHPLSSFHILELSLFFTQQSISFKHLLVPDEKQKIDIQQQKNVINFNKSIV